MKTRVERQGCWKDRHETQTETETINRQGILRCSRPRLRRAAKIATKPPACTTSIYIWKDGKVVAEKP
jgi:hypothetical protein